MTPYLIVHTPAGFAELLLERPGCLVRERRQPEPRGLCVLHGVGGGAPLDSSVARPPMALLASAERRRAASISVCERPEDVDSRVSATSASTRATSFSIRSVTAAGSRSVPANAAGQRSSTRANAACQRSA